MRWDYAEITVRWWDFWGRMHFIITAMSHIEQKSKPNHFLEAKYNFIFLSFLLDVKYEPDTFLTGFMSHPKSINNISPNYMSNIPNWQIHWWTFFQKFLPASDKCCKLYCANGSECRLNQANANRSFFSLSSGQLYVFLETPERRREMLGLSATFN